MVEKRTKFGRELEDAFREVVAHQRGEISLPSRIVNPIPPDQVKAIRKSVAKSPTEFERRFGVPARTVEGWEQGRKLDQTARVLLTVIKMEPAAVERALAVRVDAGHNLRMSKTRTARETTATVPPKKRHPAHEPTCKVRKVQSKSVGSR